MPSDTRIDVVPRPTARAAEMRARTAWSSRSSVTRGNLRHPVVGDSAGRWSYCMSYGAGCRTNGGAPTIRFRPRPGRSPRYGVRHRPLHLPLHVWAIDNRSADEDRQVRDLLLQRCWPGGISDRLERGAMPWLRRWRATEGLPAGVAVRVRAGPLRHLQLGRRRSGSQ